MTNPNATCRKTLALLAPLSQELKPTVKLLGLRRTVDGFEGTAHNTRILATIAGVGSHNIRKTLDRLREHTHPDHLLMIGFAGGLDPALPVASVIHVKTVKDEEGQTLLLNDHHPPTPIENNADRHDKTSVLSLDQLTLNREAKRNLYTKHNCAAVDMETYQTAVIAREWNTPLTALRAISDPADTTLPANIAGWIGPNGAVRPWAVLRDLVTHPTLLPQVITMRNHAKQAATRLAQSTRDVIHKLCHTNDQTDTHK